MPQNLILNNNKPSVPHKQRNLILNYSNCGNMIFAKRDVKLQKVFLKESPITMELITQFSKEYNWGLKYGTFIMDAI